MRPALMLLLFTAPALAADPPTGRAFKGGPVVPLTSNEYGAEKRAPNAVKVGETAPDFTLPLASGGEQTLSDLAKTGEIVLVFYRGSW